MNERQYRLFQRLCRYTQKQLLRELPAMLGKKYPKENIEANKDYIYVKGDIPIMLVAHLDTVHKEIPKDIFFDRENQVIWSPQGIGADDRAGVYGILKLISDGHRPHILFCRDEEIGGIGSKIASSKIEPSQELKYIIQLDRKGMHDCVFYDDCNKEFIDYIETFGFSENWGSFSDISNLCPEWEVSGVNLSVGYFNEHTKYEYLNVGGLDLTLRRVTAMLKDENSKQFVYTPGLGYIYEGEFLNRCAKDYSNLTFGYDEILKEPVDGEDDSVIKKYLTDYAEDLAKNDSKNGLCYYCFDEIPKQMLIPVEKEGTFCPECFARHTFTCTECGKAWAKSKQSGVENVCTECHKKLTK